LPWRFCYQNIYFTSTFFKHCPSCWRLGMHGPGPPKSKSLSAVIHILNLQDKIVPVWITLVIVHIKFDWCSRTHALFTILNSRVSLASIKTKANLRMTALTELLIYCFRQCP
jgi:hypothetical protein